MRVDAANTCLVWPALIVAMSCSDEVASTAMSEVNNAGSELRVSYKNRRGALPVHDMACFPSAAQDCDFGACRSSTRRGVFVLASSDEGTSLSRCDVDSCTTYPAAKELSGTLVNYQPKKPAGFFLKVDLASMTYVEVVSLETKLLINFGTCVASILGGPEALRVRIYSHVGDGWWCWNHPTGALSGCKRTEDECESLRSRMSDTKANLAPCTWQSTSSCTKVTEKEREWEICSTSASNCETDRSELLRDQRYQEVSPCIASK